MGRRAAFAALAGLAIALPSAAETFPPTANAFGGAGLLTLPSARRFGDATTEAGAAVAGSYGQASLRHQLLPRLEGVLRLAQPDFDPALLPAIDARLVVLDEGPWWPQIALGARGLVGDRQFAGAYAVANKRFYDLDLTFGLGTGRFARFGGRSLPLLERIEALDGASVAPFGGLEYRLLDRPLLRLKLEYGGEAQEFGREGPVWAAGLVARPFEALDLPLIDDLRELELTLGIDADRLMLARLALPFGPPERYRAGGGAAPPRPGTVPLAPPPAVADARSLGIPAVAFGTAGDEATLWLEPGERPLDGREVGAALSFLAGAAPETGRLAVALPRGGVKVAVGRRQAGDAAIGRGSAEEMWRTAAVAPAPPPPEATPLLRGGWRLRQHFAPAPDGGLAGRSTAAYEAGLTLAGLGLTLGGSLRADLGATELAPPGPAPVRSDVEAYAADRLRLDRLYLAGRWGRGDWQFGLAAGLLEEMFAGVSAEALYKPTEARWALGLEAAAVRKRAAEGDFALAGTTRPTGFASLYWEMPEHGAVAALRAGRFLAGDHGAVLELNRHYADGMRLGLFTSVAATERRRLDTGIALSVPFDTLPALLQGRVEFVLRPFGRDRGQRLDVPQPLHPAAASGGIGPLLGAWRRLDGAAPRE